MQRTPQITVLIPTYNCGKYLYECLGSIAMQSYSNYEILIIDDGSTDNTEQIVKSMRLPQIRYYRNSHNVGIVRSLNKGLKLSRGKYIARMDADDIMLGNRLEEQVSFLEQNLDYGMVGGSYQIIDSSGAHRDTVHVKTDPAFLRLAILFRNQFHHATITMRANIAQQLKYSEKFPYCEDHELWFRFSEVSKTTNLSGIYLSYRWHQDNSCSKNQRILKTSVLALISRELDKINVRHSVRELMLHGFICFGMTVFKFKDKDGLAELLKWYDKIFDSKVLVKRYTKEWLSDFRSEMLKSYFGIQYEEAVGHESEVKPAVPV
jgi:glycosyltransferase involved in cell wall biosynthesis